MKTDFLFFVTAVWFGVGLAMDAFSVSLANGLNEPKMPVKRQLLIAGTFGGFQFLMPFLGWFLVNRVATLFEEFKKFIPWIALILLLFIGGKMLLEGIRKKDEAEKTGLGLGALLLQGIATSIDALSVGFTIAEYEFLPALVESLIIGAVTLGISWGGLFIGRKSGTKLKNGASVLGGVILILIGIWIFVKGVFL